ncbi:BspA family leucine-rich repeat surface protein [Xylocopilactobacillus apicola]|uniref:BspA family leucine-rich repeat surface protein n=1 Tax=Xylocopilactobacillus apicola TaxID=2932184 RepID=A0AAU9DH49_9LACO|nr:BspA family leucine-rich repeat surface protein [Xylocopilactobacillus apicola]BDR57616.1 hypothetical protein XA3_00570 [Xylocopilactobacillus apicola]
MLKKFIEKMMNKKGLAMAFFIALFSAFLFQGKIVSAFTGTPLPQMPGVSTDLTTQIDGKYAFSPVVSAQTRIVATPISNCTLQPYDASMNIPNMPNTPGIYMLYPTAGSNGNMQAKITYTNVGFDNFGHAIDVITEVTTTNATKYAFLIPIGAVGTSNTAPGQMSAKVKSSFVLHGTDTPAVVSGGHITMGTINNVKVVSFDINQFIKIYTRSDTIIKYAPGLNGLTDFSADTWSITAPSQLTGIFENKSGFQYEFKTTPDAWGILGSGFILGSLANIAMPGANKAGNDESIDPLTINAQALPLGTLSDFQPTPLLDPPYPTIHPSQVRPLYSITQILTYPQSPADYLKKYQIEDDLNPAWQVNPLDVVVTDEDGNVVTNNFDITINTLNHLTIAAKPTALSDTNFYGTAGHIFTFLIKGCVNKNNSATWQAQWQSTADPQSFYLGYPNKATLTYQVGTKPATTSETNSASNKILIFRPTVKTDQPKYNGDHSVISGKVNNRSTGVVGNPAYVDFYLTYRSKTGVTKTVPWNLQNPTTGVLNRLITSASGVDQNWTAQLPDDMGYNPSDTYNQTITVTIKDQDGVSNQTTFNLGSWWVVDSNNVLTIYPHELNFDVDRVNYIGDDGKPTSDWPWYRKDSQIVKTVISPGVTAKNSLFGLFSRMSAMTSIEGLAQLDTSEVTNMSSMFSQCSSLTAIDVTNFNTSNVTDMSSMFGYCSQLPNLDVTHFDTSKVENMAAMFKECNNLTNIDVTKFDTSKVTNMSAMFTSCKKITSLDVTHFNTSLVTDMSLMFFECSSLPTINLNNFVTSNVLDMRSMFGFSTGLTTLDLRNFDTSKVTSMSGMFYYCRSMTDLKLDSVKFDTSQVTAMDNMFNRCTVLPNIDVSFFKTKNVTNMNGMFGGCAEITRLDVSGFDTEKVGNFNAMFSGCSKLTSLDLTQFNTKRVYSSYRKGMLANTPKLWKITFGPNFILEDYVSNEMLANPTVEDAINDVDNPTPIYYVTNPQWREVGTGSPHEPKGNELTVTQMMNESAVRSDTRTYVWDQVGTQTLEATSRSIDFGTHEGYLKNQEYVSDSQNIKKTDNRNSDTAKQWHIEAAVTKPFTLTTNSTKVIKGDPLYYHDTTAGTTTHLTSTGQTIYSGTKSDNKPDTKNYPWTLSFKSIPSDIPTAGSYNGQITFTLVNNTP